MNLTEHFALEELTESDVALRNGIDNLHPHLAVIENLKLLAAGLEEVRTLLGGLPIHVNSGYRCPRLNALVRGSPHSAHLLGYAADFVCREFGTPLEIVRAIEASDLVFDQVIQEGTWVHYSVDPRGRRNVLTAHFAPDGAPTYTAGVAKSEPKSEEAQS